MITQLVRSTLALAHRRSVLLLFIEVANPSTGKRAALWQSLAVVSVMPLCAALLRIRDEPEPTCR
jgi:hypothetical protein